MGEKGSIRHLFPGANTPQGFYSLYDHIFPVDANKVFVIKGGPGVGKSTFMKKIAADLLDQGYDVEFHHCSADNNSIDAIYIPAGDIAMLDGTAPHVVDPKNPGAVEEIIHLGDYWNEQTIRAAENKAGILRTNKQCSFWFKRASDALRSAKAALDEVAAYHADCLDESQVLAASEDLIAEVIGERRPGPGKARRLFASAVTYDGAKTWIDPLFAGAAKRYVVTGEPGTGKHTILGRFVDTALARGYHLDVFHCPMSPDRIDHVLVRELNVGVITSTWPHEYAARPGDTVIDTGAFLDQQRLAAYGPQIEEAKDAFDTAIAREMQHLGRAKQVHDELERFYVPHMDFAAIEARRQKTLDRILELLQERVHV